jgi:hypothetical protein
MLTKEDSADNLLNLDAMVYNNHKKWCFLLTELLVGSIVEPIYSSRQKKKKKKKRSEDVLQLFTLREL